MTKEYKSTIKGLKLVREESPFLKVKIKTSEEAVNCIRKFYSDDISIYESFFILLLNHSNNTIAYAKISQGGTVSTVVDIKIIAKYCIESLATGIITCHNHPSGNIQPSNNDKEIHKRIKETLILFDCQVIDNIIITEDSFYSFADENLL